MHASDKTTKKWIAGFRFRLVMDKEGLFVSDVVEETDCGAMVTHHASSPYICIKMIGKLHIARTLEAFFELVIEKCQFAEREPRDTWAWAWAWAKMCVRTSCSPLASTSRLILAELKEALAKKSFAWSGNVVLGCLYLVSASSLPSKCCGKGASKEPTKKAKTDY